MSMHRAILAAAIATVTYATQAHAVEGGIGAYVLGTRDTLAGIVPPPGTYLSLSYDYLRGDVSGVSIGGLPIAADAKVELNLVRLGVTQTFDAGILGGCPALNITVPIPNVGLSFTAITPPIAGLEVDDSTSGIGDITVTPILGWSRGMVHYSAALSIYAPTGDYNIASVNVRDRSVGALSNGKNVWSFQPVFAATSLNPETGLELSGAASMLFSTENEATEYQTAPAVQLEGAVLQHTASGWAFGATAYHYEQIDDDSGRGAETTRDFLGSESLRACVSGAGSIVTYSGASHFAGQASFKLEYVPEFKAKRRFESDIWSINLSLAC